MSDRTDWGFWGQADIHASASGVTITNTAPQQGDSVNTLLAKQLVLTAAGSGGGGGGGSFTGNFVPSPANANYTATSPYFASFTGTGALPSNLTSFSLYNAGSGTGTFNSVNVPPGVSLSFEASPGTKFSSVNFSAATTTFLLAGAQLA